MIQYTKKYQAAAGPPCPARPRGAGYVQFGHQSARRSETLIGHCHEYNVVFAFFIFGYVQFGHRSGRGNIAKHFDRNIKRTLPYVYFPAVLPAETILALLEHKYGIAYLIWRRSLLIYDIPKTTKHIPLYQQYTNIYSSIHIYIYMYMHPNISKITI